MGGRNKVKRVQKKQSNNYLLLSIPAVIILISLIVGIINLNKTPKDTLTNPKKPTGIPSNHFRELAEQYKSDLTKKWDPHKFVELEGIYAEQMQKVEWFTLDDVDWILKEKQPSFWVMAVGIYLRHNTEVPKAMELTEKILQDATIEPFALEFLLDRVIEYYERIVSFEEAIKWVNYAIEHRKRDKKLRYYYAKRAQSYILLERYTDAIATTKECIEKQIQEPYNQKPGYGCYHGLASSYQILGNYTQAIDAWKQLYSIGMANWRTENNQTCAKHSFTPLGLDSVSSIDRRSSGKVYKDELLHSKYKPVKCTNQTYPYFVKKGSSGNLIVAEDTSHPLLKMRCYQSNEKGVVIYKFDDVSIVGKPKHIIETGEGRDECHLYTPSFPYVNSVSYPQYQGLNKQRYEDLPIKRFSKVIVTHFADNNYYHFSIEVIAQILYAIQLKEFQGDDFKILITPSPFVLDLLKLVGAEKHMEPYEPNKYRYHADEAYYFDWVFTDVENELHAPHSNEDYYSPPAPVLSAVQQVLFSILDPYLTEPRNFIVFIERNDTSRVLFGEKLPEMYKSLSDVAQSYGLQFFRYTQANVNQQIAIFSRALVVIGVHGAGLTNIMYCKPGTIVIELPVYPVKVSVYSRLASVFQFPYFTVPSFTFYHFDVYKNVTDTMIEDLSNTVEHVVNTIHTRAKRQPASSPLDLL